MELPCVIASDLHLTSNPADEYRWGLFPWLAGELKAESARTLLLLGDLTDAKDYHGAELVNRVVASIEMVRKVVPRVVILMGNHDLLRAGHMYFNFLRSMPGVEVVTTPTEDSEGELSYFLPFTRAPARDWAGMDLSHYGYVFMHQTIKGAVASNGQVMDGEDLPDMSAAGKVYSGDIHVPQVIGAVEYVGSPYHVHFGDSFVPRCVVIDNDRRAFDLHYPSPQRRMLNVVSIADLTAELLLLKPGDQVKVRMTLSEAEVPGWKAIAAEARAQCAAMKVNLVSLELRVSKERKRVAPGDRPVSDFDPAKAVYRFVEEGGLGGELLDTALDIIEEKS